MSDQSENSIITITPNEHFITPVATLSAIKERYDLMKAFVSSVMTADSDYGIIPGTDRPTLLKPGAEKLCTLFGFSVRFTLLDRVEDWMGQNHGGEPFFYYRYKTEIYRGDRFIADAEGSANSFEPKYRYRISDLVCPNCGKSTIKKSKFGDQEWYCYVKIGGCGSKFAPDSPQIVNQHRGMVANPDPAELVNTLQKMSQKRSLIAAVLIASNASDYFSQDLEDFPEGTFTSGGGHTQATKTNELAKSEQPAKTTRASKGSQPNLKPDPAAEGQEEQNREPKSAGAVASGLAQKAKALTDYRKLAYELNVTPSEAEAILLECENDIAKAGDLMKARFSK